jgi:hypothetical protein
MSGESITIQWRDRDTKKWTGIPIEQLQGQKLGEVMSMFDGSEVVAEFVNGDKKGYFCGTEKWRDYYREKGFTSMTFKEGMDRLKQSNPELYNAVFPVGEVVADVFTKTTVEKIEQQSELFC